MTIKNAKIHGVQVDPNEYHGYGLEGFKRGDRNYMMSRSDLMEFNHCPHRWFKGYKKEKTVALSYGNMLDSYVLDNARFDEGFIVQPETYVNDKDETKKWNNNSNTCKTWSAETLKRGKSIISEKDYSKCIDAQKALMEEEIIKAFLDCSDFQVMITAEWHSKCLIIPLKCLIDIVPKKGSEFENNIADLKTCGSAHPESRSNDIYKWKYYVQAAFYTDMHFAATGEVRNEFNHILSESVAPYESGKTYVEEEFIEEGRKVYENALGKYCDCLKTGKFGGYDDYTPLKFKGFTSIGPKPYMIDKQD